MKLFKKLIAGAALAAALFAGRSTQAQVTPTTVVQLTNLPSLYWPGGTSNIFSTSTNSAGIPTNNVIQLWQGSGMVFTTILTNLASTGGALVINWALSQDGTNWAFAPNGGIYVTNTATGTGPLVVSSNVPASYLNNFAYASPYAISSTASAGTNLELLSTYISHAFSPSSAYP